ncbi:MAG: MalY/PatB family protein [Anaerolineae bacterium]
MIVTIRTGESICRGFSDASFCVTLLVHFISLEDLDSRTMIYDFDTPIERRSTHSAKWNYYAEDVLPLWVADMDFRSPEPVVQALHQRVDHGIFGYPGDQPALRQLIVDRFANRYHASITPDQIVFMPGMVLALNVICRTFAKEGDGVLVQTPVYPPFLSAPTNSGRLSQRAPLKQTRKDGKLHIEMDFEAMEAAITPETKIFILCNPHNPVGRVFTREELEKLAAFVIKHDLLLVSDEIHCDLLLDRVEHITLSALLPQFPELHSRLITLQAPSKTFNIAGLACSYAVIPDEKLRTKLHHAFYSSGMFVNALGLTAAEAAFRDGEEWLSQVLDYLRANREAMIAYLREHLPDAALAPVEGTYLAWIDLSAYNLPGGAAKFCAEEAKVGLNDGSTFGGAAYAQFVRLNFGCTRAMLLQALDRVCGAVNAFCAVPKNPASGD